MAYKTLLVEESDGVLLVTLNRPEVHNAFNDELIGEAVEVFRGVGQRNVRAVVLRGSGSNFCAGADLNWMSGMLNYSRDENVRDSSNLARMYACINECDVPVIGRIQGAAIGGGVGLVAVCDIAICTRDSKFGLAEVKLGILPAVISPYVIAKIGQSHARALFLTGERFDAQRALAIGLVHQVVPPEQLDVAVGAIVDQLLAGGPNALRACKELVRRAAFADRAKIDEYTAALIASARAGDEGREGVGAFLEKRKPGWAGGP